MNQPNGSFMPMPMMVMQPQQDIGIREDNTPPARVMVALRVMNGLNHKWQSKIAVNDIAQNEFPGPQPTKDEAITYSSALRMFRHYFDGELSPDEQEKYRRKKNEKMDQGGGTISACPLCASVARVNPHCEVCHGIGRVMSFPLE